MLLLIAIYLTLGFFLAWAMGVITGDEISVGRGVLIVIVAGVIASLVNYLLTDQAGLSVFVGLAAYVATFAVTTAAMLTSSTQTPFAKTIIVGAVYSVLLLMVQIGLAVLFAT